MDKRSLTSAAVRGKAEFEMNEEYLTTWGFFSLCTGNSRRCQVSEGWAFRAPHQARQQGVEEARAHYWRVRDEIRDFVAAL